MYTYIHTHIYIHIYVYIAGLASWRADMRSIATEWRSQGPRASGRSREGGSPRSGLSASYSGSSKERLPYEWIAARTRSHSTTSSVTASTTVAQRSLRPSQTVRPPALPNIR